LKIEKLQISPTPPLFDAPARGNPLEFLDETYLTQTRGMGLPYGRNFIILTSTVFLRYYSDKQTDGQTDGRTIAYTRYSICVVARNKTNSLSHH